MSIFYLDFELGNDANDGTTWANAWKTFTSGATAARTAPGDTIRIAKTDDPAALGDDLRWVRGFGFIKTGLKIGRFNVGWSSISADIGGYTQGYYGFFDELDIEAGVNVSPSGAFTTGPCLYHNLAVPLDLSGYNKLSIWCNGSASYIAGDFSIVLYDEIWGPVITTSTYFATPGGDAVRSGYLANHGLVNGDQVVVSGCTQAYANAKWSVTRIDANYFELTGASWALFNGADVAGHVRLENVVPTALATLVSAEGINVATTLQEFRWSLSNPETLTAVKSIVFTLNQDRATATLCLSSCYAYNSIPGILEVSRMDDLARTSEWTAAADVTLTSINAGQAIIRGMRMAIGAGFTTGTIAYKDYATPQDWSSYKYVSCLVYHALPEASVLQLLIDDNVACASPLETISQVYTGASTYNWITFRIANPAALTAVRSIGFSITADPGSVNFECFSIFLSTGYTGDCLLSNSLTGPDWYATDLFDCSNWWSHVRTDGSTGVLILAKTTGSEAGYYRKPLFMQYATTSRNIIQESGTIGNLITFSGGWNRDNTTQDGETWLDAGTGYSNAQLIKCDDKSYIRMEGIAFVRGGSNGVFGANYSYEQDYCQYNIPYVGYTYSQAASVMFGNGSVGQDIVIGTFQQSGPINFGTGSFDKAHGNTLTLARMMEMPAGWSNGLDIVGLDNEAIIGTILGWSMTSNYPINMSDAHHCRVIVTGDMIAGPSNAGPVLNLAYGQYNYIQFDGDLLCKDSGVSGYAGIALLGGFNNSITFTKTGAIISRATNGILLNADSQNNIVANVIMQNCTHDVYINSMEDVDCILQYCGLSASKIFFSGYGIGVARVRCHHFNQTLNDHRIFYAGYPPTGDQTSGAISKRNTADAETDDCIELTFNANFGSRGEVRLDVGWFQLTGGVSNTVSIKIKKSAAFNGRVPALGVIGEGVQAYGRSVTALTTSYQTYSLTFTPLRTQYAQLVMMVEGTDGSIYVDSLSVS